MTGISSYRQYHLQVTHKGHDNEGNDQLLIVEQILPISTLGKE